MCESQQQQTFCIFVIVITVARPSISTTLTKQLFGIQMLLTDCQQALTECKVAITIVAWNRALFTALLGSFTLATTNTDTNMWNLITFQSIAVQSN
jgi:hypothetical protein